MITTIKNRAKYIILFVFIGLAHAFIADSVDTVGYFFITAFFDFTLIVALMFFSAHFALRLDLSILALVSILANGLGAVLFIYQYEPFLYNLITTTIIALQLLRLIINWNGRDYHTNTNSSVFRAASGGWV